LAGDPKQLGPVTTSSICVRFGFSVSYMEQLCKQSVYGRKEDGSYPENLLTILVRNYRNYPDILKLPSEMFYDNDLQYCGTPRYLALHRSSRTRQGQ
jgi:superfamily I DNA and/or RNA helicase